MVVVVVVSHHVVAGMGFGPSEEQSVLLPSDPSFHQPRSYTFLFCFVLFFETGFLCVALAALELTL
jgi:hypothetical protein